MRTRKLRFSDFGGLYLPFAAETNCQARFELGQRLISVDTVKETWRKLLILMGSV